MEKLKIGRTTMKKKFFAVLLTICMVISLLPMSVMAEVTTPAAPENLTVDGGTTSWDAATGVLTVTAGPCTIGMKRGPVQTLAAAINTECIVIDTTNNDVEVTLNGVEITATGKAAVSVTGTHTATIILSERNVLTVDTGHAGLEVAEGAKLILKADHTKLYYENGGSLIATGTGSGCAGIGGAAGADGGTITIESGYILASGGSNAVGIENATAAPTDGNVLFVLSNSDGIPNAEDKINVTDGEYVTASEHKAIVSETHTLVANVPTVEYQLTNLTTDGKGYVEVADYEKFSPFTATLQAGGGYSLPENIEVLADDVAVPRLSEVSDFAAVSYTWDRTTGVVIISNDGGLDGPWMGWEDGAIPKKLTICASGVASSSRPAPREDTVSKTITKLWVNDNEKNRPDSVAVDLLRDDKIYRSYTLKASEDWTHTFDNCKENGDYTVRESVVPEGYAVSYDQEKLTITNSGGDVSQKLDTANHSAYIVGYSDGTVRPDNNITRGEVAAIFYRLLTDNYRNEVYKTTCSFTDVAGKWYSTEVSTLENAGIIVSSPDGKFRGDQPITRAEYAGIAARFTKGTYTGEDKFTDIAGHWGANDINLAAEFGWVSGYADNTFRPDTYITRAEVMTLTNFVLLRDKLTENSFLNSMISWPDNTPDKWYYKSVQEATNSHEYTKDKNGVETWTKINTVPSWK